MADWKRICCAVDLSEPSRLAMEEAAVLARRLKANLTLVHVREFSPPLATDLLVPAEQLSEMAALEVIGAVEAWRASAERSVGSPVRTAVLTGEPATEIARFAREKQMDVVVIGTHGRTGLRRLVLGSVAERVLRLAHCPVLAVRRKPPARGELEPAEVVEAELQGVRED